MSEDDVPASVTSSSGKGGGAKKSKRSTESGEARIKLIGKLTEHHEYSNGSCLNLNPIANNELARQAEVAGSTASKFFDEKFGGHIAYRMHFCCDESQLITALKLLNDEFTPGILFNQLPDEHADAESDDDDDE